MPNMRVPLSWLNEFLSRDTSAQEAADRLADAGLYVWSIERPGATAPQVVVGRVEPSRPDAPDELRARIPTSERVYLPPGSATPPPGTAVAVALPGALLYTSDGAPHGLLKIPAPAGPGGEIGRICDPADLGLTDLTLPADAVAGAPVSGLLPAAPVEEILNVDVRDNLVHCRGLWGLATEIERRDGEPPEVTGTDEIRVTMSSADWTVAAGTIPWAGRPTPPDVDWRRATLAGLQADGEIDRALLKTAYEYGVRLSTLVVPPDGPLAVAVGDEPAHAPRLADLHVTTAPAPIGAGDAGRLLILAAAPTEISPSGTRCRRAVERAASLLRGGGPPGGVAVARGPRGRRHAIELDLDAIRDTYGFDLSVEDCVARLARIGADVEPASLVVSIPPLRADLRTHEDLAAEIMRLTGYEAMAASTPTDPVTPRSDRRQRRLMSVRRAVAAQGFQEVVTQMVVDLVTEDGGALRLESTEGAPPRAVRRSLLPGLLATATGQPPTALFEVGRVIVDGREVDHLAVIQPGPDRAADDPWDVYRVIDAAARAVDHRGLSAEPSEPAGFEPGTGARLLVDGHAVGDLGDLLSPTGKRFHAAEVDLGRMMDIPADPVDVTTPPRYPTVQLDVNLVVPDGGSVPGLLRAMRDASPLVRAADVADVYRDPAADRERVLTVRMVLGSDWRTLSKPEAIEAAELGVAAASRHGARRR